MEMNDRELLYIIKELLDEGGADTELVVTDGQEALELEDRAGDELRLACNITVISTKNTVGFYDMDSEVSVRTCTQD